MVFANPLSTPFPLETDKLSLLSAFTRLSALSYRIAVLRVLQFDLHLDALGTRQLVFLSIRERDSLEIV